MAAFLIRFALWDGEAGWDSLQSCPSSFLEEYEILVPPISIQEKIIGVLRRVERLREIRERANQLTNKIMQSEFLKMFGDPATNPMGWKTEILGSILEDRLLHGQSLVRAKVQSEPPGFPVFKLSALTDDGLNPSQIKYYNDSATSERQVLRKEDILISRSNTIEFVGRVGRYGGEPSPCIFPDLMIRVRPDRKHVEPTYLEFYLRTPYVKDFFRHRARGTSGSMPKISNKDIEEVEVRIPPMELQKKFILVVKRLEGLKDRQRVSQAAINELFHSFMFKAFRGELTTDNVGRND